MGSFSKCSTGYWPALGEGYVSTSFHEVLCIREDAFGPISSWLCSGISNPPNVTTMRVGVLGGRRPCGETLGSVGLRVGTPGDGVSHTPFPSQPPSSLPGHANPSAPLVIMHPTTNSQETSKWKDGTHLFLMCCGEPRHRKLPWTMMASLVHTASHSSMLWETRPGVSRSPRLRAWINRGMGKERHAIIENQLTFHIGTSQSSKQHSGNG